ncbi:MAG: cobyrinate a,c-diamide synthase [Oscillospiraceae bacterium]|nr:cobyrinate a,c-diamide synthase [Oscillospiraceae bacterium]
MKTLMIAAIQSGAGKTVTVCALLAALKKRGLRLQAFKCGPDYIDPMFHARVLGVPSRNLDLFLQGKEGVKRTLSRAGADFALVEGAMGYYDGLNNSDEASAWALARLTGTPVVLVVSPKGSDLTLAAQIRGLMSFRPDSGIAALILASCPEARAASLSPVLERETGLPVLGFLPPMDEAHFESRHLGLMTAAEIGDLEARLEKLGDAAERYIDLDRLVGLAGRWETAQNTFFLRETAKQNVRVAAARDEAFCFTYADNLDALREAGAELVFFSPLHDAALPEADGLYLPGGYPELHARALSENTAMRQSIQAAIARGLPTVAECGGFLYLQELLEDAAGNAYPMCGVLPGRGFKTPRLQRFGYLTLRAAEDSLLFRAGEEIPAHEFHYWDSTENGEALCAEKADGRAWRCGYALPALFAAFPHLHFGGETPLAERFVKACETWNASMT